MAPKTKHETHDTDYILELLDRGYSMEFVAKDAGITVDSLERRIERYVRREFGVA